MLIVLAVSLLLTLALEEGFALLWGLRGRRELGLVALMNCLTNPPVVLLYHTAAGLWHWNAVLVTLVLEAAAVVVEWLPGVFGADQAPLPLRAAHQSVFLWRGLRRQSFIDRRSHMKKQLTGFLALLAALLLTVPAYADAIMPGPGEVAATLAERYLPWLLVGAAAGVTVYLLRKFWTKKK